MKFTLRQKNILITGGSLGIGLETARCCLQHEANVLICARTQKPLDEAVSQLRSEGYSSIRGRVADVSKREEVKAALDDLEATFGPLSATIHAAGIFGPIGSVVDVEPEEWFEGIKTNLFGSFLVARESCLRFKHHQQKGRIVLFSGGGAAYPFPYYTSYACSKVAIVRFAETLAQEMAPYHIEVNCLAPGFVVTRLHQQTLQAQEKAGTAFLEQTKAQIKQGGVSATIGANAAAFLSSDLAQGITGKFISAPYDAWQDFPQHLDQLKESDLFTLRRIVLQDRGISWS